MSSPVLPDEAGTVSHLWVDGGVIKDTKGCVWTETGSIPRVGSTDLGLPGGAHAEGLGPTWSSCYLQLGSGADVLDFTSNFFFTFIARPPAGGGTSGRFSLVVQNALPWCYAVQLAWNNGSGSSLRFVYNSEVHDRAFTLLAGATNVFSVGIANAGKHGAGPVGGDLWTKCNLEAASSLDVGMYMPTSQLPVRPAYVGGDNLPSVSFEGTLVELRSTATVPTQSLLDLLHGSLMDANYVGALSTAQQQGAASIAQPSRFFGHFHMH